MAKADENAIPLSGLDGGNLLALLAALGTLRALSNSQMPARMSWTESGGTWRPVLHTGAAVQPEHVIDALDSSFAESRENPDVHPCMRWTLWSDKGADRRDAFDSARIRATARDRGSCDWLSAIGCDAPDQEDEASDTPLRAPRSDYLIGNLRTILETTNANHLRRALFAPWTYDDPLDNCSLKFDPGEDRRHALQWCAPTKDRDRKKRGNMLGANRLAIEAIPLFTSALNANRLATAGCSRPRGEDWRVTWCLWDDPLSLDCIRSLLSLDELLEETPDGNINEMGFCAVFRCRRETVGKTRVFSPARRIL